MSFSLIHLVGLLLILGLAVLVWYNQRILRRYQTQLNTLFQHAPLAIIVLDESAHILAWNNQAAQVFKWQESEVLGHNVIELLAQPDDYKSLKRILDSVLNQKTTARSENWNQTKHGQRVLCEWLNAPYSNQHGSRQIICMARLIEN